MAKFIKILRMCHLNVMSVRKLSSIAMVHLHDLGWVVMHIHEWNQQISNSATLEMIFKKYACIYTLETDICHKLM